MKAMKRFVVLQTALLLLALGAWGQTTCPVVKVETERLPDLHCARTNHLTLCVDGEPMVVGGHTSGFKPTPTAEYYSNGEWHLLETVYTHDDGLALPLSSGQVLLAGGHKDDLGIGQIHSVERYIPATHTLEGFGCLDTKRVMLNAVEIDSGRVVISGNWYHDDNMELYDGNESFTYVKDVAQPRAHPYMFRTARDNAVVFGVLGTTMDSLYDSIIVDRLHGTPFTPPLFRHWKPLRLHHTPSPTQGCIGEYTHLFPVADSTGQVAIALLRGEEFQLLPTDCPVPTTDPQWREHRASVADAGWTGRLQWGTSVIADRRRSRAYMVGTDSGRSDESHVFYVLAIDYAQSPARLTLYHTDPMPRVGFSFPVLTPEGHLFMAGGALKGNFKPFATALLLRVGIQADGAASGSGWWVAWVVLTLLVVAAVFNWRQLSRYKERRKAQSPASQPLPPPSPRGEGAFESPDLLHRITALMDERKPYLDPGLKMSDVADALAVHRNEVSACINAQAGCSFSQFVNRYRVEYAQQLLRSQPDMKVSAVSEESGFATESSFFRAFKALTGMTPREWIASDSGG